MLKLEIADNAARKSVTIKAPKSKHYSGSESPDLRLTAAAAQIKFGTGVHVKCV